VKFQWDERKNKENIRSHGFDFANAWEVFGLPMLTDIDAREVLEQRLVAIGFLRQHVVVVIFVAGEDDTIRIISLRKALKYERERFEEFLRNELGADRSIDG
jgi:uncharacterized DUF497 family protein